MIDSLISTDADMAETVYDSLVRKNPIGNHEVFDKLSALGAAHHATPLSPQAQD